MLQGRIHCNMQYDIVMTHDKINFNTHITIFLTKNTYIIVVPAI